MSWVEGESEQSPHRDREPANSLIGAPVKTVAPEWWSDPLTAPLDTSSAAYRQSRPVLYAQLVEELGATGRSPRRRGGARRASAPARRRATPTLSPAGRRRAESARPPSHAARRKGRVGSGVGSFTVALCIAICAALVSMLGPQIFGADAAQADSAVLRIPRRDINYVVPIGEGISLEDLAHGAGHVPGTAGPGEIGNFAVVADSTTNRGGTELGAMRPGDYVVISSPRGTYAYVLDTDPNDIVVSSATTWILARDPLNPAGGTSALQRSGARILTLIAPAGNGAADSWSVAFGHLVSTSARVTTPSPG